MMKTGLLTLMILLLAPVGRLRAGSSPGDYDWWNKQFHWDGYTHWRFYMKATAAYMGPNALPVPQLNRAEITPDYRFELRPEAHLSQGDKTYDVFTSVKIPLAKNVDFEVFIVPYEIFYMDTNVRNERVVRHIDASGSAGGDFWFGTNIKIVGQKKAGLDILASIYYKTASGTALDYARYTDSPGYYMHLAMGRTFSAGGHGGRLRLYGHGGVYIYQTWSIDNPQMDAISWGAGVQYSLAKWFVRMEAAGYYGYWNEGDRPAVLRLGTGQAGRKLNLQLFYEAGLHDFDYQTIGLALVYKIPAGL